MTWLPRFLNDFFQPLTWRPSEAVSVCIVWMLCDSRVLDNHSLEEKTEGLWFLVQNNYVRRRCYLAAYFTCTCIVEEWRDWTCLSLDASIVERNDRILTLTTALGLPADSLKTKAKSLLLKHFFDISTGFRYKRNGKEFSVHV